MALQMPIRAKSTLKKPWKTSKSRLDLSKTIVNTRVGDRLLPAVKYNVDESTDILLNAYLLLTLEP
jgi:hypothetical protein